MGAAPSDDLAALLRWQGSGGTWAVLARREGAVTLALTTCTGEEEMARLVSRAPDLLAWLDARATAGADADPAGGPAGGGPAGDGQPKA